MFNIVKLHVNPVFLFNVFFFFGKLEEILLQNYWQHLTNRYGVTSIRNTNVGVTCNVVYEEFARQYSNLMMMCSEEFEFRTPPEAPVFEPTDEEFKDPFAYINKIRPIAEKSGICKIRPPAKWQPPFALDVDKFKFTPRVQRLNELEAKTRIKINFLDQIAKFWELQGSGLKIPVINKKVVDLYSLYNIVDEEDGVDCVNSGKKWENVARKLGYPEDSHVGGNLKHYYEKILYPYSVFQVQRSLQHLHEAKAKQEVKTESKGQKQGRKPKIDSVETGDDIVYKPRDIGSRSSIEGGQKNNGTTCSQTSVPRNDTNSGRVKYSNVFQFAASSSSKELKRLQFSGPGPKMAGFETVECKRKTRNKKAKYNYDPLAKYICHNCGHGDGEESMLLCDGCDDSYHTYCLIPPLREVPKGDWQCPQCVAQEVDKPMDAFGFEQARREYTLRGFGKMADKFKSEYFNMPVDLVPGRFVEKEFWRIAASIEEDVIIEYGADLHTMDHGSGFPTRNSRNLMPVDEEYVNSPWNLNNLPILDGSVLSHIGGDVSGMKIPWMYVGMCFSTFCWHIEDHWSYSINFLHWGEAKTWYGVPGSEAEHFESVMKSAAPELFRSQPDLLHQLVTLMNPNILMDAGVPIVRTDQKACEFVITFPRSYHCGFNQGFNLAEAVNFAPPDWLKIGRECILHYANFKRYCVFSHDELVCTMGANTDLLSHSMADATYDDLLKMIINEKKLRKSLCEWGVKRSAKVAFEIVPDDERQCEICKTTCFLSAVACSNCNPKQVACLRHYRQLCDCPSALHIMKYRYTLEELESLLIKVKCKAELADNWATRVKEALEKHPGSKIELEDMKELVEEAKKRKYPNTNLLNSLTKVVSISEKCVWVAKKLLNSQTEPGFWLTLSELQTFVEELTQLPCNIKETGAARELLANVMEFQKSAETLLEEEFPDSERIANLLGSGLAMKIEVPIICKLQHKLKQVQWLEQIRDLKQYPQQVTVQALQGFLNSGFKLPPCPIVESVLADLQGLLTQVDRWEDRANGFMNKPYQTAANVEALIKEGESIPAYLPTMNSLRDALEKAREWTERFGSVQQMYRKAELYPYIDLYKTIAAVGYSIPVHLEPLAAIQSCISSTRAWKRKAANVFLKNSRCSLLQALLPRSDMEILLDTMDSSKSTSHTSPPCTLQQQIFSAEDVNAPSEPSKVFTALTVAGNRELDAMKLLRIKNLQKRVRDTGRAQYCFCYKAWSGVMLRCELCNDWFHAKCISVSKSVSSKTKQNANGEQLSRGSFKEKRFLCPPCLRTRRPLLLTLLPLLIALYKIPVRLQEGEALVYLLERALDWQERAKEALAVEEVTDALAKMSTVLQNPGDKTEYGVSCGPKKTVGTLALGHEDSLPSLPSHPPAEASVCRDEEIPSEVSCANFGSSSDQAISKTGSSGDRSQKPSPLVPLQFESPLVTLRDKTKAELEELLMEGDLLEVELDERYHIWRVLQATEPRKENASVEFDSEPGGINSKSEGGNRRKRMAREIESGDTRAKKLKSAIRGITASSKTVKRKRNVDREVNLKKRKKKSAVFCVGAKSAKDDECEGTRPNGNGNLLQFDGGCDQRVQMYKGTLEKNNTRCLVKEKILYNKQREHEEDCKEI